MFRLNHKVLVIVLIQMNVMISQVSQGGNPKSFELKFEL